MKTVWTQLTTDYSSQSTEPYGQTTCHEYPYYWRRYSTLHNILQQTGEVNNH